MPKNIERKLSAVSNQLKALKEQQKQIADYKKFSQTLTDTASDLDKAKKVAKALSNQLMRVEETTQQLREQYTKAGQAVKDLDKQQSQQIF